MRWVVVVATVAGQEGDATAGHLGDPDRRRRVAVRRRYLVLDRVGQEGVEAGAADDGDIGLCR